MSRVWDYIPSRFEDKTLQRKDKENSHFQKVMKLKEEAVGEYLLAKVKLETLNKRVKRLCPHLMKHHQLRSYYHDDGWDIHTWTEYTIRCTRCNKDIKQWTE